MFWSGKIIPSMIKIHKRKAFFIEVFNQEVKYIADIQRINTCIQDIKLNSNFIVPHSTMKYTSS